jgi:hypothetical protein
MFTKFKNSRQFLTKRLVFQQENSPKSPENFQSPEKKNDKDIISEVASQSPSQIVSDTLSRGGAVQKKYTQNTQILANLLGGSGNSSTTTTTTSSQTSNTSNQK